MRLWRAIILTLLLGVFCNSRADIGKITEQANQPASITRQKSNLVGKKGVGVDPMDSVQTTNGKVGITFEDDTKVQVNDHSKLVIDDFVYDPKQSKNNKLALKFARGTIEYASGSIAHHNPRAVALNTPVATVAVRGTDFTATVDELGESTIINLPSCPKNWVDVDRDCKTGIIDVYNDAGKVTLDKPFEGTKVISKEIPPLKPVILHLNRDTINNLLIVSPPSQLLQAAQKDSKIQIAQIGDMLAVNYLQQNFLQNEFDKEGPVWTNPLTQPLLQQYFLEDIFNILSQQLQQENAALLQNLLAPQNQLLPDWFKASGITKQVDPQQVGLCRTDSGSNTACVTTPTSQNSTVYIEQQDGVNYKNRVNAGGNSIITIRQN